MGAVSRDLSSAAMAAAIEASWIGAYEHFSRTPRTELHDEEPDLRWFVTPSIPHPIFNHAYVTRLSTEEDIDARIEVVVASFAEHGVPFMWSVGPFTQSTDLGGRLGSRSLSLEAMRDARAGPPRSHLAVVRHGLRVLPSVGLRAIQHIPSLRRNRAGGVGQNKRSWAQGEGDRGEIWDSAPNWGSHPPVG